MYLREEKRIEELLRNHDEAALDEIMKQYLPLVSSIIFNIGIGTLTTEDIEEAAMDTFVTLWKNSGKVQDGALRGYLCAIAKTKAFDKLDSVKKNNTVDVEDHEEEDGFSIEENLEQKEANEILIKIIMELDPEDREIVIRYYYYYQRIGAIAEHVGMSPGNVKVKLHRARAKIKKLIEQGGYRL